MATKFDSKATESEVMIADITVDPELQMRVQPHDRTYIEDLAEALLAGKVTAPVIVFRDTEGLLRLADGHARVEAAKTAGKDSIRARVYAGGHHDAFMFALGANAKHGARRTREDLHKAVKAALADPEMRYWSNVQIAEVCACSDPFVGKVRDALPPTDEAAAATHRQTRNGKMQKARKPKRPSSSNGSNPPRPDSVTAAPHATAVNALPEGADPGTSPGQHVTGTAPETPPSAGDHVRYGAPLRWPSATPCEGEVSREGPPRVVPPEPPADLRGDIFQAPSAQSENGPATVPTDASAASPSEVIPSATKPTEAMRDPITQLHELLPVIRETLAANPQLLLLTVPAGVIGELRGDVERFITCLHDQCRPVDVERSVPATASDLFHDRMGYNPNPSRPWDVALLGVFEEDLDQERMSA